MWVQGRGERENTKQGVNSMRQKGEEILNLNGFQKDDRQTTIVDKAEDDFKNAIFQKRLFPPREMS